MTRREMHDRAERRMAERVWAAQQAMETRRPWLSDAEPEPYVIDRDGRGGPRMLSYALAICACLLVLGIGWLSCRAWAIEDDLAAKRVTRAVAILEGR